MTYDEAKKIRNIYEAQMSRSNCEGNIPYAEAISVIEGYEQGVSVGYASGVRDSAKVASETIGGMTIDVTAFGLKKTKDIRFLMSGAATAILALLEPKLEQRGE